MSYDLSASSGTQRATDSTDLEQFITGSVLLDLEVAKSGQIYHIGAVFGDRVLNRKGSDITSRAIIEFDAMASEAKFVMGHNILGHDLPLLKAAAPQLGLYEKPILDTLYISPLAFPQNPYHRLVKDYKLIRSSLSDPVSDARLSREVFREQWASLHSEENRIPGLMDFYRFCFEGAVFCGFSTAGLAMVFALIGRGPALSPQQAADFFIHTTEGVVCANAVDRVLAQHLADPALMPVMAYCLAWLSVSGSNSVLPPWVRHRFPQVLETLKDLRDVPCDDQTCSYCRKAHNIDYNLTGFFGFDSFREKPATENGKSLQREVVKDGNQGKSLLAILPTGGGKSLCYQLPALIRHWRRGLLTVVFSPLQALMIDQVEGLVKKTGTPFAELVCGLQTSPERGAALDRVRMGDAALLYIAPEQLRSMSVRNALKQREVGCWVFDEAHCLSKWGHDFRPDYLYAARFIREFTEQQNLPPAPVCCYTATAKSDVVAEISEHFREELKLNLVVYAGGVERDNLSFEVLAVGENEKFEMTLDQLQRVLGGDDNSCAIVYVARRETAEQVAEYLKRQGMTAEAFHAGLDVNIKQEVLTAFMGGAMRVICATNAFGMGVDKENIRLVLHFDMPGSMENYLQEAGRAGRDRHPARCVLLYNPEDANTQFGLTAKNELRQREIIRILRALRRCNRNERGEIVVTIEELIRDDEVSALYEKADRHVDTRVRTAVSWLERAGFLTREHNQTDLFQGKPTVSSLEEATTIIDTLNLSTGKRRIWIGILSALFNWPDRQLLSVERLGETLVGSMDTLKKMEQESGQSAGQIVLQALHNMANIRLIDQGLMLSAILRSKGKNNALSLFSNLDEAEKRLIGLMQSEDPESDDGSVVELSIQRMVQRLKNDGVDASPPLVRRLIKGLSYDGKGLAGSHASIELLHLDRDRYQLRLLRDWASLKKTAALRRNVAFAILRYIVDGSPGEPDHLEDQSNRGYVRISFSTNDLETAIRTDITLFAEIKKMLPAIERALLFLHENKVIVLQGGLAAFRQAMTIRLNPAATRRRYSKGDFKPLQLHYKERRFQIHAMMEYVRLAQEKISMALRFVLDYFTMPRSRFARTYFSDREHIIEMATSEELYRDIVERLANPVQMAIVASPVDDNALVLAGPGSGKTTVIVHRCAYLLMVERVPARQILALCFNHGSAVNLRKRLVDLAGRQAYGVTVTTYHGAALRLSGVSVQDLMEGKNLDEVDFDAMILDAVRLLRGEKDLAGVEPDDVRDRLLAGYSHILVDEYQDIDKDQYDLVSAIAGRTLDEEEGKLTIMAVGDDDQNVYSFRGANVEFIKRFQEDYDVHPIYLVENYRSSKHIITAANQLIAANRDRMKTRHDIQINRGRRSALDGGHWALMDTVAGGRVQVIVAADKFHQAACILSELERLKALDAEFDWCNCAVLGRTRETIHPMRSVLEEAGVPVRLILEKSFPLRRVREVHHFVERLTAIQKENRRASEIMALLTEMVGDRPPNRWWLFLQDCLEKQRQVTADALLPVQRILEMLYDHLAEQKRERVFGTGIFVGTVHSSKGMEFKHVFVMDGGWSMPISRKEQEDERRLLYVAMTRARETLAVMKFHERPNPFLSPLRGNPFLYRTLQKPATAIDHTKFKRYEILGLEDVYMDFAGCLPAEHGIHTSLSALQVGDQVNFSPVGSGFEVRDNSAVCIAKLSGKSSKRLAEALASIYSVSVVAMLQRDRCDPAEEFLQRIRTDSWEMPVLEIAYRESA